jgi:transcriptional regulator with XRE-family HTH domain
MLRIKWERLRREWSQEQLGAMAQLSATDISKIERRFLSPYPEQRQRLAKALGIRPEELLEEVEFSDENQPLHTI